MQAKIGNTSERGLVWRYTVCYLLAMGFIAGSIIFGAAHISRVLELNRLQGRVINAASEQRALAQQLVLLPDRFLAETNGYRKDRVLAAMSDAIDGMRTGHVFLTEGTGRIPVPVQATDNLQRLYSSGGAQLNAKVEKFIEFYERFLKNPKIENGRLQLHRVNAEDFLFPSLDLAIDLHTKAAETKLDRVIELQRIWVLVSLALIGTVVLFVFRPLTLTAAKTVASMSAELDERAKLLSQSMKIAKLGHWRAINETADPIWLSQELLDLWEMNMEEGFHNISVVQARDVDDNGPDPSNNTQHEAFKRVWRTGKPETARSRFRKADGKIIELLVRMEAEFDPSGEIVAVVGAIKDDTAEVKATRALEESYKVIEKKSCDLIEAQRLGNLATWRIPLNGTHVEWDERAFQIMRLDPDVFDTSLENVSSLYLGEEVKRLKKLQETVMETREEQSDTVSARRGDGAIIDLHLRCKLELDAQGEPRALFGTIQDVTKEREAARELEKLAYFETLTGLANRTLFSRELKRVSAGAVEQEKPAALMLIDLDHFKEVNDTLGHQAGDELLEIVGRRLSQASFGDLFVARLGGDEFGVLCKDDTKKETLNWIAQEIIDSISRPASLTQGTVQTNASIGIALAPDHSSNPDELLSFADLALYCAKEQGRGRSAYYDPSLSDDLSARMSLGTEIRAALQENRFEAHYQPIIDAVTGRVSGFEALLRLPKKEGGFIPPGEFIPVAESSHLIADLGSFILHRACREAQSWVEAGLPRRIVSVNVSAAQIWHGDLEHVVDSALQSSGLDPVLLCIELTETVFADEHIDRLESILKRLKQRGIQLALDDFGTGYSSLGYLNRLPFDRLKIDRIFVTDANASAKKHKMLLGMVSLAQGLGLKVTAEGVETEAEFKLVKSLGCENVQGWHFGIAMPGPEAILEATHIDTTSPTLRNAERRA